MGKTSCKSDKLKILFLLEGFNKGGIEKVTLDIVNNLDPDKYDITVQTFWYGGHCQSLVNGNVRVIPFFFKRYVKGVIRLIEYLPPRLLHILFVRDKYDVEIAASDGGAAKVISGSRDKNSKKICWVHMDVIARGAKLKGYENAKTARKIYEKFDRIVCVSSTAKDRFIQKFGSFPDITYAHNPLPDKQIKKMSNEPAELPNNRAETEFVTVGRLAVEKGYDRLITACNMLVKNGYSDFHVNIVGDGECKDTLASLIDSMHLEKYVSLLGFKSNPYPYISNADCYICSSSDEAFSLSIGESLILGIPVIGTACSGVDEWLDNGNSEYGIRTENSTNGIYAAMEKYITMPKEQRVLLKNRAEKKSSSMSMEKQLRDWLQIMQMEV